MAKQYKYKSVEFEKITDNVNKVNLSSIYDNPCGNVQFAEVDDIILDALISDTRDSETYNRYVRDWETAVSFDETNGTIVTIMDQYTLEYSEEKKQIIKLFRKLNKIQRRRLYLHYQKKMTYEEIAKLDGVPRSCVFRSCLHACQVLKRYGSLLQKVSIPNWVELLIMPIL